MNKQFVWFFLCSTYTYVFVCFRIQVVYLNIASNTNRKLTIKRRFFFTVSFHLNYFNIQTEISLLKMIHVQLVFVLSLFSSNYSLNMEKKYFTSKKRSSYNNSHTNLYSDILINLYILDSQIKNKNILFLNKRNKISCV